VEDRVRNIDVVLDEVAFGQAHLGKEDLLGIGDLDLAAGDKHAGQL
jgi:hypothetical protein